MTERRDWYLRHRRKISAFLSALTICLLIAVMIDGDVLLAALLGILVGMDIPRLARGRRWH